VAKASVPPGSNGAESRTVNVACVVPVSPSTTRTLSIEMETWRGGASTGQRGAAVATASGPAVPAQAVARHPSRRRGPSRSRTAFPTARRAFAALRRSSNHDLLYGTTDRLLRACIVRAWSRSGDAFAPEVGNRSCQSRAGNERRLNASPSTRSKSVQQSNRKRDAAGGAEAARRRSGGGAACRAAASRVLRGWRGLPRAAPLRPARGFFPDPGAGMGDSARLAAGIHALGAVGNTRIRVR